MNTSEFRQRFGSPTPEDVKVLQAFQAARQEPDGGMEPQPQA